MSEGAGKIAEGVFAINKPPHLSSAQVLRDLQNYFRPSTLFAPRLRWQQQQASQDQKRPSWKQRNAAENIKIGHGGTLDPLATGVLVVGVGAGTKQMNSFLGCTKTYETVVLFGRSTDTYDVAGKKIASAPFEHVTRALVEEKLAAFRGKIKQMPPIYSALKIDGMKAYDYARTGKELPRELEAREMEVQECELVEWFEGSRHEYRWPAVEASIPIKNLARELVAAAQGETQAAEKSQKRKLSTMLDKDRDDSSRSQEKKHKTEADPASSDEGSSPIPVPEAERELQSLDSSQASSTSMHKGHRGLSAADKARLHTHEVGPLSSEICPAPAARIRVTVSSGFYVRSFAHDLGVACRSLALMATLFRSRQAEFDASSALTYEELEGGEDVWGPTVEKMLDRWNEQHPEEPWTDDRDRPESSRKRHWSKRGVQRSGMDGRVKNGKVKWISNRDRRNTSSGED